VEHFKAESLNGIERERSRDWIAGRLAFFFWIFQSGEKNNSGQENGGAWFIG
jgi:hypothetical protein